MTADELFNEMTPTNTGLQENFWHSEIKLAGVQPISLVADTLTLRVRDKDNLAWLERAQARLELGASQVAGRAIRVAFTLNGHHSEPAVQRPEAETQPATVSQPAPSDATPDVIEAATSHILAGFSKHSHYLTRFVRAYLGAAAFDTWDFIRSHCKDSSLVWTPARDFTGVELARGTATPYQRIVGVWRNCGEFDRVLFETGEMIACCRRYWPAEMTTTKPTDQFPNGRPTCRHWVPGALEVLEAEGLAVYQKHGDTPRNTFFAVQVYQHPPLLTPLQASRFVSKFQIEHREFVKGLLKSQGIELTAWTAIDAFSFLPLLTEAAQLAGLELPLPEVGVFSALARNHIFFESATCANEGKSTPDTPDCTQAPPATVQPVGLYNRSHRIRGHKK